MKLLDVILSFFSNMFDILLLRGGMRMTDPLREMAMVIANRFLI